MAKKKPAAEHFRNMLAKNPNIKAQTAVDRLAKKGIKSTPQNFADTKRRMLQKASKAAPAKAEQPMAERKKKAQQIRELIAEQPKITIQEAKEQLPFTFTSSAFYTQRKKVLGKTVAARKASQTRKRRQQQDEAEDIRSDYVQQQVELELIRQQNQKFKAVIAALL
jgi:hypothetical protein